ncbi:MAG TPA: histone deacetylase [Nocardioidaceae bacterium]|nr:histone deacetylase [Nocardioidaceae bacterium]
MTATQAQARPLPNQGEVWYVSYGSNMSEARLACYIEGGCPPGGSRHNPGARDPRLPRHSIPVKLPGSVYFAGESTQWGGGGVAFYDHEAPGPTAARAYLVTAQQFADIAAQEMFRVPDPDDPIEEIVLGGLDPDLGGRHHVGPGHYETLVEVGRIAGAPMLTFTAPHGIDHVDHTPPSTSYLSMLAEGLREGHGWGEGDVEAYFSRVVPDR